MTTREYFVETVNGEIPKFEKVMEAIPETNRDYKPDPKSRTALELAAMLANEATMFGACLKTGALDYSEAAARPVPPALDGMIATLKAGLGEAAALAQGMTEADWDSEAKMLMGGKEVWKTTKGKFAMGFMLDMIHHRGQLTMYLRPMGGKVPSVYGPSADTEE